MEPQMEPQMDTATRRMLMTKRNKKIAMTALLQDRHK